MAWRIRSTCFRRDVHGAHDWDKGDASLWCPGTDGSNPQIPAALRVKLRELYPKAYSDDQPHLP
jgi:hypothetical protein